MTEIENERPGSNAKRERVWHEWLATTPDHVRQVAEKLPPWQHYELSTTGQRCVIVSFQEHHADDSVSVTIHVDAFPFVREVFGIDPADLKVWVDQENMN